MQTRGIGLVVARKLLATFGLPENIFSASHFALGQVVSERIAHAILTPLSDNAQSKIEQALIWATQSGNHILTLADSHYPPALLDISDPPLLLYVKGNLELLSSPSLAIVGSRNASTQGLRNAENFAHALSNAGLTIISGLALGIDAAAHRGGLRGSNSSIAVVGTGADIVYPARNHTLAHQIAAMGCIVSEYPLGTPAIAANFPRRNRIISGLARGVLVIEAAAQSGSLITARMAGEQGREVFAIPGSIHSPLSKGCHQLIKQGAKLVESAQDVLEELRYEPLATHSEETPSLLSSAQTSPQTDLLLSAMGFDPISADTLCELTELEAATMSAQLLILELEGLVERLPSGMYQRLGTS